MTSAPLNALTSLRQANMQLVCDFIAAEGPTTQAELARRLSLSRASISNIVKELKANGIVDTSTVISRGRRAQQVYLCAENELFIGLELNRHKAVMVLCDLNGEIKFKSYERRRQVESDGEFVQRVIARLDTELDNAQVKKEQIKSGCIAVAAPVDPRSGKILSDEFFKDWDNERVVKLGRRMLDCSILVDNDANLAALGQKHYGLDGIRDCFSVVIVDEGIGAGLVIHGEPYAGNIGIAGEIGHNRLENANLVCRCGNVGCIETVASTKALLENAQAIDPRLETIEEIMAGADNGVLALERLITNAGTMLGKTLVPIINTLNPAAIYFAGSALAVDERFLRALRVEVSRTVRVTGYPLVEIKVAHDWEYIAALGAAVKARIDHQRSGITLNSLG